MPAFIERHAGGPLAQITGTELKRFPCASMMIKLSEPMPVM